MKLLLVPVLLLAACGSPPPPPAASHADHGPEAVPGRVVLSEAARQNLGLTFAKAEYRVVQGVLRLPGRFEPEPAARRVVLAPLPGRIELLVRPFQAVAAGDALCRLESPEWLRLAGEISQAEAAAAAAGEALAAATARREALRGALAAWQQRVAALERLDAEVGGRAGERAEAAARLADLRVALAEAEAGEATARREAEGPGGGGARTRLRLLYQEAAQVSGLTVEALTRRDEAGVPLVQRLPALDLVAPAAGVVEAGTGASGSWVEAHAPVLTVTDPAGVYLQAHALQADLPRLGGRLAGRIVSEDRAAAEAVEATVVLAPLADATDRTLALIARPAAGAARPVWARPGVTALLEIALGPAEEELAIPVAATADDGLERILFRRDRQDPAAVQRLVADLGVSDGRWVVVNSGLKEGDEVVVGGLLPLKLNVGAPPPGAGKPDPHANCGGH